MFAGVVQQKMDFAGRIVAGDAADAADVGLVHGDDQIIVLIIGLLHRPGRADCIVGDAMPAQDGGGRRIDRIPPLFLADGR